MSAKAPANESTSAAVLTWSIVGVVALVVFYFAFGLTAAVLTAVVALGALGAHRTWSSRGFRKFRRNKMGMAASAVILVYALVALAVLSGLITLESTTERVGPMQLPGFGLQPEPEARMENAESLVNIVQRALNRKNVEAGLAEIRLGRRVVAKKTPEEIGNDVKRANALLDELSLYDDLNEEPAALPKLEELEGVAASLFAPLEGTDAVVQWFKLLLGTDRQGRSISTRAIYAVKVAVQIGVIVGVLAVLFGALLGAAAAFFGGWVDQAVQWLYSTLSSIPYLVLLGVLIFMFDGGAYDQTLIPLYAAFIMTFWIGPCRIIRGEALRIKELDYVQAATAVGQSRFKILLKHILPNTSHLIFINFSLLFIGAIKSEVILTFLGLGVKNEPSWGIMISQSKQEVVNDFFWQIGAATFLMFGLVLAFNIFTDALQDALDPKHIA